MPDRSDQLFAESTPFVSAVEAIYAAVEAPEHWPTVLEKIADLVEGENVVLFASYADSIAADIQAFARSDGSLWERYRERFAAVNVWTERCDKLYPAGAVRYSHRAIATAELEKTEFYNDFLRPNGLAWGFGIEVALPDRPPALLSSLRSRERGPFEEKEGSILRGLLPHLQRALRLHFELASARSAREGMERALDAFERAVFGLNQHGKVLFSNHTARQLLSEAGGLRIKQDRLHADIPQQDDKLQCMLQHALQGAGFPASSVLVDRRCDKPAFRVTAMPVAGSQLGSVPGVTTLVFVDDPSRTMLSRAASLRMLFRLSPTEARLADLLLRGMEVREAAECLGTTVQTTRFHLKRVLAKTGARRQSDMVRMMLSIPGSPETPAQP
jgi:DNA-binding CsgD family transcriptional regulator